MARSQDPTDAIRRAAAAFPDVEQGTSCTQSSFKAGGSAFLYIGMQGGRWKAMFKLSESRPQAEELAQQDPDAFQVGSTSWVTARFSEDRPLPKKIWSKWLNESYRLCTAAGTKKKKTAKAKKAAAKKKKAAPKKSARPAKKQVAKKKTAGRKAKKTKR